jgi:Zn-dependent peptidase ImmA (M78 family)
MLDIACALELNISETIRLPSKPQPALTLLKTSGISKAFITARLVPRNWKWKNPQMNNADLLVAASDRLEKIFGYKIDENGIVANDDYFRIAASEARFKVPADADTSRVTAYAVYARHLASIVISATKNLVKKPIPQDPKDLRIALLREKPLTFENLLNGVWDLGIPVLPLCDPIRFHGVCWRINGKNIIVLKQSIQSESRWSFDLIHELVHASENPDSDFMNSIECDPTEQSRRESEEEVRANNIAGEVLLNGKAQELYQKVMSGSNNNVWQLSNKIKAIAKEEKVNVADLANHVAFRLKEEKFIDFWAMAAQLQPMKSSPFDIAKKVFFERLDLNSLSLEDKDLILQALDDIKLQ